MLERTSDKAQYGIVVGRKLYKYKRGELGNKSYREPRFIGVTCFKNKAEALKAKAEFDKPIRH